MSCLRDIIMLVCSQKVVSVKDTRDSMNQIRQHWVNKVISIKADSHETTGIYTEDYMFSLQDHSDLMSACRCLIYYVQD